MFSAPKHMIPLVAALSLIATGALAQPHRENAGTMRMAAPRTEPAPGPHRYQRVAEPKGWNNRPATMNRAAYNHNYQATRSFKIGPYHPPAGWTPHHWSYGQILPSAYWAAPYILADYWLFGFEVPPVGFEWVRDGADALLINTTTGEIVQVEYGVFA